MAKAGFWLRGSKGKLAGASMGKGANGSTIIREIVTPKNPKTDKQLWQRAIMATIMQAYAQGKEIFNHSFQGYSVGAACQHEFVSRNSRALRALVSTELNANTAANACYAHITGPSVKSTVPNRLIVSTGGYQQQLFTVTPTVNQQTQETTNVSYALPAVSGNETVAEYVARVGLLAGDIYTFVFFTTDKNDPLFKANSEATDPETVYRTSFNYVRLIARDVTNVATAASAATFEDLFVVESSMQQSFIDVVSITTAIDLSEITGAPSDVTEGYSIALIRSRFDQDLRSNSEMIVVNPSQFGLYYGAVLDAWRAGVNSIGDSSLILEGGSENSRSAAVNVPTIIMYLPGAEESDPPVPVEVYKQIYFEPKTYEWDGSTREVDTAYVLSTDGTKYYLYNTNTATMSYQHGLKQLSGYMKLNLSDIDAWTPSMPNTITPTIPFNQDGLTIEGDYAEYNNARILLNEFNVPVSIYVYLQ